MIFFTRCIVDKKNVTYNQIWSAPKKGNVWGDPTKLNFCVDSEDRYLYAGCEDGCIIVYDMGDFSERNVPISQIVFEKERIFQKNAKRTELCSGAKSLMMSF